MAPSTQDFIKPPDLQQILSDALASFSPLATLVGSDSARSLTHYTTNTRQICVASMAPIGALGMMANVCKGSKLSGLKAMLGAGDADIFDSCVDLGCGALHGVIPHLNQQGTLSSKKRDLNPGTAACGILRASCVLGSKDRSLDMDSALRILENFGSSTVTGRFCWVAKDNRQQEILITKVHELLLQSWMNNRWDPSIFESFDSEEPLKGAIGSVELHWPAPAMNLETNGWVIYAYGLIYCSVTIAVILLTTFILHWQSIAAALILLGGQALLVFGHILAQWSVKYQRKAVYLSLPRKQFSGTWMLVDNVWFTSQVAKRAISNTHTLKSDHIRIGQYASMKRSFIPTWHVLLTLTAIGIGFIAFYIGARSSNVYSILVYIFLFFIVNTTKGSVIEYANKAYMTPLNNFGFVDVIKRAKPPGRRGLRWCGLKSLFTRKRDPSPNTVDGHSSENCKDGDTEAQESKQLTEGSIKGEVSLSKTKEVASDDDVQALEKWVSGSASQSPAEAQPLVQNKSQNKGGPDDSTQSQDLVNLDNDETASKDPKDVGSVTGISCAKSQVQNPIQEIASNDPYLEISRPVGDRLDSIESAPQTLGKQISSTTPTAKQQVADIDGHQTKPSGSESHSHSPKQGNQVKASPGGDIEYRVFTKFALRSSQAIGMFYFSHPQLWGMSSHVIFNAVQRHVIWRSSVEREPALHLPFWYYDDSSSSSFHFPRLVNARLVLAIDETRYEDLYWNAGQELVSIIMGNFVSTTELPSESERATDVGVLGTYVFFVTKLFMQVRGLDEQSYREHPGILSLMRAIDLVKDKYPFDDSSHALPHLVRHAQAAVDSVLDSYPRLDE